MSERAGLVKTAVALAFRRAIIKITTPNASVVLIIIAGVDMF